MPPPLFNEALEVATEQMGRVLGAFRKGLLAYKTPDEVATYLTERYLMRILDMLGDPERRFLDDLGGGKPE